MSRVRKPDNKFVNANKYNPGVTNTLPMRRYKGENADFTKAITLSSWLFLKYDMSYRSFRRKSKKRRDELRDEFFGDTGRPRFARYEPKTEDGFFLSEF